MQQRILAALKAAGRSMSPAELSEAVRLERPNLNYHCRALIAAGVVKAHGNTSTRRLSLP